MKKIRAMNAKSSDTALLNNSEYIFEPKLDGYRALCYVDKKVTFLSRNDINLTPDYPELEKIRDQIDAKTAILDGEIVVLKSGKSDFQALQRGGKAVYFVFDILMKNGKSLIKKPLLERKKLLKETIITSTRLKLTPFTPNGKALWKKIIRKGGEGVMAKEKDGAYHPGKRSGTWLKIKRFNSIDCIIIGYTQQRRTLSSLLLGLYTKDGTLQYLGKVGTGFDENEQAILSQKLSKIKRKTPPVAEKIVGTHWVSPRYVCEVKFAEVTKDQRLRAPVYVQLRPDKKAKECTVKDQLKQFI